nr:immunoglobulin heavy chain junction region [Macaca mulatta]
CTSRTHLHWGLDSW